jgi:hypothetical protein
MQNVSNKTSLDVLHQKSLLVALADSLGETFGEDRN